jgi:hypothetical protein
MVRISSKRPNLPNNLLKQMTNTPNEYEYSYQNSQPGQYKYQV